MTDQEMLADLDQHIGIAMKLFGWCWHKNLAMEYARHAVITAICTHNGDKSSLATHVHYMALKESTNLRRYLIRNSQVIPFTDCATLYYEEPEYNDEEPVIEWTHIEAILAEEDANLQRRPGVRFNIVKRLSHGEEYTHVAKAIGISRKRVQDLYESALKTLRKKLQI